MQLKRTFFVYLFLLALPVWVQAQNVTLQGIVRDQNGKPVPFATISLNEQPGGSSADINGAYSWTFPFKAEGAKVEVVFRSQGFKTIRVDYELKPGTNVLNANLPVDVLQLEDAVVIGYGTARTKDLTGSAVQISEKDFNETPVATPEQLIMGKVAGVKITSNDGAPGSGSNIRIRGGTSINASNDPLIVVDGVPLDNGGIAGSANALALINPNDIESFVILKDASATAIYGSRGANGVILITTKKGVKGNSKFSIGVDHRTTVSVLNNYSGVLTGDQFRALVDSLGTAGQKNRLDSNNTNWQAEIYRAAIMNETSISFTGGISWLPYRLSVSARFEDGVLQRDRLNRYTASLNLNPSFFDGHLAFNVQQKFTHSYNFFANRGAIGSAVIFDPTKPVFSGDSEFGGYFEWIQNNGKPNNLAPKNPVGLLNQRDDFSQVYRWIGNIETSYKLHFFPQLRAVVNVGGDFSNGSGETSTTASSASGFNTRGSWNEYTSTKWNRLADFYLNFSNADKKPAFRTDLTVGYSYQDWSTSSPSFATYTFDRDSIIFPANPNPFYTKNVLISYYGRGIVSYKDRYVLNASLRRDGSSRFSPDQRWGLFPALSAAWLISEESFLKGNKVLTYLKLRGGYGVTGQQDIFADYPYIPNYQIGTSTALYPFGGEFLEVWRPDGYDPNIRWETTSSYNLGLDFGILNDRINGSVDVYHRRTDDLLAMVAIPAGTNFTNELLTNVGSMENTGVEIGAKFGLVDRPGFRLDLGVNATYNINQVLKLSQVNDSTSPGILVGGIAGGIGNNVQIHTVGFPTFSYYVYEQRYDENGRPIEANTANPNGGNYTDLDAFVDRNGDGVINVDDRYRFEQVAPDWFLGLNLNLTYKRWTAGFSMRGEIGGHLYNNIHSNAGTFQAVGGAQPFLNNISSLYYLDELRRNTDKQLLSDHYIERADFLRMDYFTLGYNFGKPGFLGEKVGINASFTVNNVFVVTGYQGLDPEVVGGIDNSIYPRSRMYTLNLSLNF